MSSRRVGVQNSCREETFVPTQFNCQFNIPHAALLQVYKYFVDILIVGSANKMEAVEPDALYRYLQV